MLISPFRLSHEPRPPQTNIDYNVFRDYNSTIGRYVEADPIGLMGGINPYIYVQNNPINRIDPLGLKDMVCNIPESCEEKANRIKNDCMSKIDGVDNIMKGGCVAAAVTTGVVTGLTLTPATGYVVGGIMTAGCFTINWEDLAYDMGKAMCGFLSQKIYQACKASEP